LERADGRLRMASVCRRDQGRGGGGRECERLHGRRGWRLRPRDRGARRRRQDLLGLDGRRRVARTARGQGAAGRGGDSISVRSSAVLIAGNWKMYKGPAEAGEFCRALRERLADLEGVDVAVCPSFVSLAAAVTAL